MEQLQLNADELKKMISNHAAYFQLNAHFATIIFQPAVTEVPGKVTFGKYHSAKQVPYPFYKPYSKIINIKEIE
ncbi:hypothetical protein ACTHGU_14475 [Chitinophagaceae bacterium MMS25-I14]